MMLEWRGNKFFVSFNHVNNWVLMIICGETNVFIICNLAVECCSAAAVAENNRNSFPRFLPSTEDNNMLSICHTIIIVLFFFFIMLMI